MKEIKDKLQLLLNDLRKNKQNELEKHISYFNTDLFVIRIKEILELCK